MNPGLRRLWKISILFSLQILSSFKQKKGKRIESSWFVRLRIDRAIYIDMSATFCGLKREMLTFDPQDFLCYGYRLFSLGS